MICDLLYETPHLVKKFDGQIIREDLEVIEEEVIATVPLTGKFIDLEDVYEGTKSHKVYHAISISYLNVQIKGLVKKYTIQVVSLINKDNCITHWLVPCELSATLSLTSSGYESVKLLTEEEALRILNTNELF